MGVQEIAESAALLEAMAETAAVTYYDLGVKFGFAKYPKNGFRKSRNWSKFLKVARICILKKIPVEQFVREAVEYTMERHAIITLQDVVSFNPADISSSTSGSASGSSSPSDLWNLLSCKLLDMVFTIDGVGDKTELLDSTLYGFPAWFRVFSPHEPVQRIIIHWGDLAAEELSENPGLDSFLKLKRPTTHHLLKSVMEKI